MIKMIALSAMMLVAVFLSADEPCALHVTVVIDSVEEGMASVFFEDGEESFIIPAAVFPGEAQEGRWYSITVQYDQSLTAAASERIRRIFAGLSSE